MIGCIISTANCPDKEGLDAICCLNQKRILPSKIYADSGYRGRKLISRLKRYNIDIEIVNRKNRKDFQVEPKRWIVERTFAWMGKFRRLSKDYELNTDSSTSMLYLAMIRLMIRRISHL